ncbi:hypothetical protein GQ602_003614 [Ophiocordyceps camponoti-floridani]|uniref:NodB homology domain-containing protein n=1 Tax=Ophiocordyceps camponoti-floridani TaxID=2030778 RepID=A0A8H4VEG2_9HYPO|nr:hypothetical protein GQ602_003614 [Ophiocordyceps camponoti-floridani]
MVSFYLLSTLLSAALLVQATGNTAAEGCSSEREGSPASRNGGSTAGKGGSRSGGSNSESRKGGNSGSLEGGEASGNKTSSGGSQTQKVQFGKIITNCTVPNSYALSFDDGPHIFTMEALDKLKAANKKATFFVNGDNFSKISERAPEVKRMIAEGHQLGSHTFRHPDLTNITDDEIRTEMTLNDREIKKIIGKTPTYMRPPFFSTDDRSIKVLTDMQYKIINANIDTKDFENLTPETNDKSFVTYQELFNEGGSISLMHDVHNTTVNQLLPNVIDFLSKTQRQLGECLGDPPENWYRDDTINGKVVEGPTRRSLEPCSCGGLEKIA